jgi:hypothetical protein
MAQKFYRPLEFVAIKFDIFSDRVAFAEEWSDRRQLQWPLTAKFVGGQHYILTVSHCSV